MNTPVTDLRATGGENGDPSQRHRGGSHGSLAPHLIALMWSAVAILVLCLLATGGISTYIRGFWQPLTLVSGILAGGLAFSVLRPLVRRNAGSVRGRITDVSPVAWLILVPVLLVVITSPSPLGAAMLTNTASAVERDTATGGADRTRSTTSARSGQAITFAPLQRGEVNDLSLEDLHNRITYGSPEDIEGPLIRVSGFISHGAAEFVSEDDIDTDVEEHIAPVGPGGPVVSADTTDDYRGITLNRFRIFCCAADAIAYSARLNGDWEYPDDTWVEVTGRVTSDATGKHPVLTPESVKKINAPRMPYL